MKLTDKERDFIGFGPKYGRPGEGIEYRVDAKGNAIAYHSQFREWIDDEARTVTEYDREWEHPFDERATCEDCQRLRPEVGE